MNDVPELSSLPRRRRLVNSLTSRVVALGGAAVIAAIALIFIYLLWVIAPVFAPAGMSAGRFVGGRIPRQRALRRAKREQRGHDPLYARPCGIH